MPGLESVGTLAEMQHPILSLASTPVSLVPSLAVDSSLCELFDMLKDSLELIVQGTQQFRYVIERILAVKYIVLVVFLPGMYTYVCISH